MTRFRASTRSQYRRSFSRVHALFALCIWIESVGRPFWQRAREVARVDPFGFSWRVDVLLRKSLFSSVGFPWISLDSLVRIETFQWVTRHKLRKIFSCGFLLWLQAERSGPAALGMRKGRIAHEASLARLPIFCNKLSSPAFPFAALDPNAAGSIQRTIHHWRAIPRPSDGAKG